MNSILIGFHKKLGNIGKVDTIFIQWLLVLTGLRFRRRTSRRCGDLKHSCHGVRISRMQSRMQVVSLVVVVAAAAAAAAAASIKHDDDEALWFLGRLQNANQEERKSCCFSRGGSPQSSVSDGVKRSWRVIREQNQSRIVDLVSVPPQRICNAIILL